MGTKEAVPALAALLNNRELAHYARFGLQPIPDPSVDAALRAALPKLKGTLLVGAINSIGYRKDAKAVKALARLLQDSDAEVARAAAAALGSIGGPKAARKLQPALSSAQAPVRPAVAGAALVCAEGPLAKGHRKQALALYEALGRDGMPKAVRAAAQRGEAASH